MKTKTIYISIGNSDDKLTQQQWASFYRHVNLAIRDAASAVHGQWVSEPAAAWQNACWCVEIPDNGSIGMLRGRLAAEAAAYLQDSIAWAEVPVTEFLAPEAPK